MRRHDNVLYVTTQGAYLSREGESLLVRVEKETRFRVPVHTLGSVVCFGQVSCSPFLMGLCAESGVGMSFLTRNGRFLARVEGPVGGNVLLRKEQFRRSEDPGESAKIARAAVIAKAVNSRTNLQRALRDHPDCSGREKIAAAVRELAEVVSSLGAPLGLDEARGLEGHAARVYFEVFDHLIVAQKDDFRFAGRSRRPPTDNVNALLSFLYAILANDVRSACEAVGLDPQVGFLHRDRPGRAGLALDLMEELRPILADRIALSLINRRQVAPGGFRKTESGGVEMDDETRKAVLVAHQKRKDEELTHPFLNEKITVGLLPLVQARLLSRYLRGDLDAYPPMLWR